MTNGMMLLLSSKNCPPSFIPSYKQSEQNADEYSPNRIHLVFWINFFHNCNRYCCKRPYCKYYNYFSHLSHLLSSVSNRFICLAFFFPLMIYFLYQHCHAEIPIKRSYYEFHSGCYRYNVQVSNQYIFLFRIKQLNRDHIKWLSGTKPTFPTRKHETISLFKRAVYKTFQPPYHSPLDATKLQVSM